MLVIYVLICIATLALITLISSAVLMGQSDPGSGISLGAFASLIISAMLSGFGIAKLAGDNPRLSMIAHLIAALIMLAIGLILGGGTAGLMNSVCYLGIAALFSLLGKRKRKRPRRKRC